MTTDLRANNPTRHLTIGTLDQDRTLTPIYNANQCLETSSNNRKSCKHWLCLLAYADFAPALRSKQELLGCSICLRDPLLNSVFFAKLSAGTGWVA